jgi:hypothetical protein
MMKLKIKIFNSKKKTSLLRLICLTHDSSHAIARDSTNFYFKKYILSNIIPTRCLRFILYQTTISSFKKKIVVVSGTKIKNRPIV